MSNFVKFIKGTVAIFAICLFLGIMTGASAIYGLEYIDRSYKNILDIEQDLNLPVLGIVPKLNFIKEMKS